MGGICASDCLVGEYRVGEVLRAGHGVPSAISTEGRELVSACHSGQNQKVLKFLHSLRFRFNILKSSTIAS